jgi:hypothetical protein
MRELLACIVLGVTVMAAEAGTPPPSYANWAAIVVAGDHADSDGRSSEGFDNARRDVTRDLFKIGFVSANMAEFSVQPREYRHQGLLATRPGTIARTLSALARKAQGGCLVYLTSHGAPEGVVLGNWIEPPRALARLVDQSCGTRPTVVIISACFSGVMLPPLAAANRLVITAARRDRTSFGCGQTDRYPYFDQCVLQEWPGSTGFPDLGQKAIACVRARELRARIRKHSEPQISLGAAVASALPPWPH